MKDASDPQKAPVGSAGAAERSSVRNGKARWARPKRQCHTCVPLLPAQSPFSQAGGLDFTCSQTAGSSCRSSLSLLGGGSAAIDLDAPMLFYRGAKTELPQTVAYTTGICFSEFQRLEVEVWAGVVSSEAFSLVCK